MSQSAGSRQLQAEPQRVGKGPFHLSTPSRALPGTQWKPITGMTVTNSQNN